MASGVRAAAGATCNSASYAGPYPCSCRGWPVMPSASAKAYCRGSSDISDSACMAQPQQKQQYTHSQQGNVTRGLLMTLVTRPDQHRQPQVRKLHTKCFHSTHMPTHLPVLTPHSPVLSAASDTVPCLSTPTFTPPHLLVPTRQQGQCVSVQRLLTLPVLLLPQLNQHLTQLRKLRFVGTCTWSAPPPAAVAAACF